MTPVSIEIAPTVQLDALAHALRRIGLDLYSSPRGYITVQPGRPRMVGGGNRRRAGK